MRKIQTNPNWGIFHKIAHFSKRPSHKKQGKTEKLSEYTEETCSLNVTLYPGLNPRTEEGHR